MSVEIPDTLYVPIVTAARILGVHRQTLDKAIAQGAFVTKRISGRTMILTSSLRPEPEPMTLWWRHVIEIGGIRVWIVVTRNETNVSIGVSADRGFGFEETDDFVDSSRLIPSDLNDRRIVTEAIKESIREAVSELPSSVAPATLRRALQDIDKNYHR